MQPTMTYTLQLDRELATNWGWFEGRGYLPAMPGTLVDFGAYNRRLRRFEWHLTLTEAEADAFRWECEVLGEAFGAGVAPDHLRDLTDFLYETAL